MIMVRYDMTIKASVCPQEYSSREDMFAKLGKFIDENEKLYGGVIDDVSVEHLDTQATKGIERMVTKITVTIRSNGRRLSVDYD